MDNNGNARKRNKPNPEFLTAIGQALYHLPCQDDRACLSLNLFSDGGMGAYSALKELIAKHQAAIDALEELKKFF